MGGGYLCAQNLDRRVHGIRILSPRPALIRAVGSRLWPNVSGPQLHLQQVSRGWARLWPIWVNLPLIAVFRPQFAVIRRELSLQNRHLRVGTSHPRLVLRRSLAAKELP